MFYFHNGLHRKFFLHVISNHTQQKAGNGVEFLLILYSHHNQSWYATYFTYCPVSTSMKYEEKKYVRITYILNLLSLNQVTELKVRRGLDKGLLPECRYL